MWLDRGELLFVLVIVCLLNGLFSPFILFFVGTAGLWLPWFLLGEPGWLLYLSSLAVATLTLLLSGVPAALYERLSGSAETNAASATVWLGSALVLSIPAGITLVRMAS